MRVHASARKLPAVEMQLLRAEMPRNEIFGGPFLTRRFGGVSLVQLLSQAKACLYETFKLEMSN